MAGRRELTALGWRVLVETPGGTPLEYGFYRSEADAEAVLQRLEKQPAAEGAAGEPRARRRRRGKRGQLPLEGFEEERG
jgi:hypothetical protein